MSKINRQSIGISGFTSVLKTIDSPPNELYISGLLPKERPLVVAIVGSRRPTPYGVEVTRTLAYDLAKHGVIIVSGLALGVDAIAHKAALEAGGVTIAVLAGGLHKLYPASNAQLGKQIVAQGGALISERPPGYEARPYDFLARNRIISGLADAVIVTEATDRSGTFSTATHALTQNKELFAVPGPVTSLLSAGSNRLIQQGAHVATCAEDILRVIDPTFTVTQSRLPIGDTEEEEAIVALLRAGERDGEALQQKSALEPALFLRTITMLEIKGYIHAAGGNTWTL